MINARAREIAREMAGRALTISNAVRKDTKTMAFTMTADHLLETVGWLAEATTALSLAVERLAEVSEAQDEERGRK